MSFWSDPVGNISNAISHPADAIKNLAPTIGQLGAIGGAIASGGLNPMADLAAVNGAMGLLGMGGGGGGTTGGAPGTNVAAYPGSSSPGGLSSLATSGLTPGLTKGRSTPINPYGGVFSNDGFSPYSTASPAPAPAPAPATVAMPSSGLYESSDLDFAAGGHIQHYDEGGDVDINPRNAPPGAGLWHGRGGANLMPPSPHGMLNVSAHFADGGHVPEFYSEGGMHNRFVKGAGDGTSDDVPAMLANGEFVIPADVVSSLGNGSNDSGAKVLDHFLETIRAHKTAHDPKKLPPDSKGALAYISEAHKKVKA